MRYSIRKLAHHTTVYGVGHVLSRAVSFLLLPLYTNFLSQEQFGVASLLFAYVAVMTVIYGFGIDSALLRYYIPARDPKEKCLVVSTEVGVLLAVSAVLSAVQFIWAKPLAHLLLGQSDHAPLLRWCAGILWFDTLSTPPFLLLRARERSLAFVLFKFAGIVIHFLLTYLFLVPGGLGLQGIFAAGLLASAATFLMLLPVLRHDLRFRFDRTVLVKSLRYGLPYLPSTFAVVAIDTMDRYLLKALTNLETVGIYSAGYRLGMIMGLLVAAFRFAWMPFFLGAAEQENARALFARVLTYFVAVGTLVFLLGSLFMDDLVRLRFGTHTLFAPGYWHSTRVVPLILLGYLCYGVYVNLIAGVHLEEKTGYLPLLTGAGALTNLILNLLLIPWLDMMGAAWATVAAYALMAVMAYRLAQRLFPVVYEWRRMARIAVVAAVLFAVAQIWPLSAAARGLLVLLFPVLLVATGFLNQVERQRLHSLWRRTVALLRGGASGT